MLVLLQRTSSVDDVQLANYITGLESGPVEAWRVDRALARALGVSPRTVVWVSDCNLTKIRFGHKELDFRDYCKIHEILENGYAVVGRRERSAEIYYLATDGSDRIWRACVKATEKNELFLTTFHRTNKKEMRRVYRKALSQGTLIRDTTNGLARLILRRARHT